MMIFYGFGYHRRNGSYSLCQECYAVSDVRVWGMVWVARARMCRGVYDLCTYMRVRAVRACGTRVCVCVCAVRVCV